MSRVHSESGGGREAYRGSRRDAFTLLELLVVTAILGMVVAVIGASLAGGIRVWDLSAKFGAVDAEAAVGFRMIEKDLLNRTPFFGIPFAGSEVGMSFPCRWVERGSGDDGLGARRIGTVKYEFLAGGKMLVRKRWIYPGVEPAGQGEAIVEGLEGIGIEYAGKSENGSGGAWQSAWGDATNHPSQVRVRLRFLDGGAEVNVSRTVVLPVEYPGPTNLVTEGRP